MTLRNDVKELAVGDFFEVRGVGEIGRAGIVHFGLWAISLPRFAVAFGTLIEVDRADLFCACGRVEWKGIFQLFGFKGNSPKTAGKGCIGKVGGQSEKNDKQYGGGASGGGFPKIGHDLSFTQFRGLAPNGRLSASSASRPLSPIHKTAKR